jgi:lambda family phage portal protein
MNPVAYYVLRQHPGDTYAWAAEYDEVPASEMLHWFRRDRPRQFRGVPEITSSLPLFAQLRRYTLATLSAAEVAADFAALLKSQAPAPGDDEAETEGEAFETLEIERGMMTTLPAGTEMQQLKAEQPTTTYGEFKRELLKEIGRPCNAPFNVISGDSSLYNYSSARLDHLLYRSAQKVERDHCRRNVLDRVFAAWYAEARLIPGYLPAGLPDRLPHAWYWPGSETIDPLKEALGDQADLANGTTTLAELLAEHGQSWEEFLEQRARELALMKELDLPLPVWANPAAAKTPAAPPHEDAPAGGNGDDNGPGNHRLSNRDLIELALRDEPRNGHNGNGRAH